MRTIVVDLDGTMCDVEHRRKYVQSEPKNWTSFNAACVLDKPNRHVLMLYDTLARSGEYQILFFSGRSNEFWEETVAWLDKNVPAYDLGSVEGRLWMRDAKDRRPDNVVKLEMLQAARAEGYDIVFSIDDRSSVVQMWRDAGVPCFQCNPGDF